MSDTHQNPPITEEATLPPTPAVVAKLVENHRQFLEFLERRVRSREVAEDILQEAFVRGITRAGQVRDEESAVAWFYRVLRNALTDHWRRTGTEQRAFDRVALESESTSPPADDELMNAVCRCTLTLLDTLKPEYAEALRRVDLEGASVHGYAETAGITANNASVRLFRAREALRKQVVKSCGTCTLHGCLECECGKPRRCPAD